jgi:putative PEP-CTERM system TPR-repeat lipoprotein
MKLPCKPWIPVTAVVASLCLALSGCDRFTSVQTRIDRATAALGKGDLMGALTDARAAAGKEPNNPQVTQLLARISLKQGNVNGALAEIERAIAQGLPPATAVELKAEAQLAAGKIADARQTLGDRPTTPRAQVLLAQALFQSGLPTQAQRVLQEVLAGHPDQPDALLLQARGQLAAGDPASAGKTLDDLLEAHPDFARGWQLRAQLAMQVGNSQSAIAALERARKTAGAQLNFPEQWTLLLALGQLKLDGGNLAGAAADIEALRKAAPDAPPTELLRARLMLAQKDVDGAVALLQKSLVANPTDARLRRLLALALSEQGSHEQAINQLTSLLADDPADVLARRALAEIYLVKGNLPEAGRVMREAPNGSAEDAGSEWLRAAILARSGNGPGALAALERAAAVQKSNVVLQVELARAYLSAGRLQDARQLLEQQPGAKLGVAGRTLQALTLVVGQSPQSASSAISAWASANPDDVDVQVVTGRYFQQAGDVAAAQAAFKRAQQISAASIEAGLGLAELDVRRGDSAAAEAGLRELVKQNPRDERGYVALALLARRQGNSQDAENFLKQSIGTNPAAVESRLLMAELAAARKDVALMKSMLTQALTVSRDKPSTLLRAGNIQLAAGNTAEALASFDKAATLGSQPAILRAGAVEASQQRFDAALRRVTQYRNAGGSEAAAEEFRGGVLMAQKKYAEASAAFDASLKLRPSGALVAKAFSARQAAGAPQPEAVLKSWLDRSPGDHAVRMLLADRLLVLKQYAAAAQQFEIIAKAAPAPAVLNNLAWTYQQLKDRRALDIARQAYEASGGSNAQITDTYGWILSANGRNGEALPLLKKATEAMPDRTDVLGHYADALEAAGSLPEAAAVRARIKSLPGA